VLFELTISLDIFHPYQPLIKEDTKEFIIRVGCRHYNM